MYIVVVKHMHTCTQPHNVMHVERLDAYTCSHWRGETERKVYSGLHSGFLSREGGQNGLSGILGEANPHYESQGANTQQGGGIAHSSPPPPNGQP